MFRSTFNPGAAVSLNPQPIPPGFANPLHPPSPIFPRGVIVIGG